MAKNTDPQILQEQYANSAPLDARIRLHERHSTNKQGMYRWLQEIYTFSEGDRILECGCGTGKLWEGFIETLPQGCTLLLSDFSRGMVETVWKKFCAHTNMTALQMDIMNLPLPDASQDIVIANHMLHHVPDTARALAEIARVLRPGGHLYCTANGEKGLFSYLRGAVRNFDASLDIYNFTVPFTMQNGEALLRPHFAQIEMREYLDSLAVTETRDLIDWMRSTISFTDFPELPWEELQAFFENIRVQNGGHIPIPKQSCVFIAEKTA